MFRRRNQGRKTLLVIGVPRSGTSATTEMLSHLGLNLPVTDDLMAPEPWNERGYFESSSLSTFDEALLQALGGSVTDPPALVPGWEHLAPLADWRVRARILFAQAFPDCGTSVWKDPRQSILLPFWREVLSDHTLAAVFVWRHPIESARSLCKMLAGMTEMYHADGEPSGPLSRSLRAHGSAPSLAHGLALWELYTRESLTAMAGLPVFVSPYSDLLARTGPWQEAVARWLHRLQFVDRRRGLPGPPTVTEALRHEHLGDGETAALLSRSQQALWQSLQRLETTHSRFAPPALAPIDETTTELLRRVHLMEVLQEPGRGLSP